LRSSLLEPMLAIARGDGVASHRLEWLDASSVTTVIAAAGYPDAPRKGDTITIEEIPRATLLFHAGTARDRSGTLVTAGGRVAAITALADTFADACRLSREGAERIRFEGRYFRADIGWRELGRHARAS
jgi:phosphoribosylamine-glycine ligase